MRTKKDEINSVSNMLNRIDDAADTLHLIIKTEAEVTQRIFTDSQIDILSMAELILSSFGNTLDGTLKRLQAADNSRENPNLN